MTTQSTTTKFNSIPKRKDHAFKKDVYLLGRLNDDHCRDLIWLEAPSWDCEWYWGFGYLEVYTNQSSPSKSKDISMHTHWDSLIKGDLSVFAKTTFTSEEGEKLCKLFPQFYALEKDAAKYHRNNDDKWKDINENKIPEITSAILAILTPKTKN